MAGLFALGIEARRAGRAAGVECGVAYAKDEPQKIPAKNGADLLTTVSCLCIFNSEQMCIFVPCGFCLSARKELKMNKKEPVVLNSEVEMSKTLQIRNSTIDFLVFTKQNSQDSIEVRVQDENVWLTQDGISRLFDVDRSVVTKHLKNVFETNELEEISVCAKFAHTAADGKTYNTKFYNLDAIISVGCQHCEELPFKG
jgi:hypothetical protein